MGTWWIDEPFILGSSNPTDAELERLYSNGFRLLVCLLDEQEQSPRYDPLRALRLGYARQSIPVRDFHAPTVGQLKRFVDLVRSVGVKSKVIVHCEGGTGRTGTMAAAYWIAKGLRASQAIEKVRRVRPGAVEIDDQKAVLEEFEMTVAGSV